MRINIEINDILNYAMHQNGAPLVREIRIKNETEQDVENLRVSVRAEGDLIHPFEQAVQLVRAGEEYVIRNPQIKVNGERLSALTERIQIGVDAAICRNDTESEKSDAQAAEQNQEVVFKDNNLLSSVHKSITVLAYDEWPGAGYYPELLTAFAMPNHPVIAKIIKEAAEWMKKWTGDPSLEGYQSNDPNRVKKMAAAVYAVIQSKEIVYAMPPASFEVLGQRIRLADAVIEQRLGTCLDLTLLYISCLEAMGLHPFMVLMKGHIFAGVWLMERSFSDAVVDDPSQIEKRMSQGIHEMIVVETTLMCAEKNTNFDDAVKYAQQEISSYKDFIYAIDVVRARRSGICPLPLRMKTENGFEIRHEDGTSRQPVYNPEEVGDTYTYQLSYEQEEVSKQIQWERKLLDLSLRNMLINMRLTKSVVPLLSSYVGDLEDALVEGEEFQVLPRPKEWDLEGKREYTLETTNDLGQYAELIASECKHRRLHTIYAEEELNRTLTKLYRTAKISLEENGASTLYLALGLLRWYEDKKSNTARYAPIVLIPIDIVRKSARKGYMMRMRDEDAQINITLLEFLKQNYDIRINGLTQLQTDEHGLDMRKIFATIRHGVMEETMWDVIESGFIGNFSFAQFVMWNDIHHRPEILERNKIVKSLMNGSVDWDTEIPVSVDTDEAYLPITADDSQLRAINMAAADVSFVLHGPPGTGKSQTITAMIANALTRGKTVLFVAEKMAALEVVQKRLASLGIENFCLELHSNKAVKRNVLDQLKRTLEIQTEETCTDYENKIEDIRSMRRHLDTYVQKLHEKRPFGKSLRELIDLYELIPEHGIELHFKGEYVDALSQSQLENQRHLLERLIAAGQAIGHPSGHPLSPIGQTVYSQSLKMEYRSTVTAYKQDLEKLKEAGEAFAALMGIVAPYDREDWNYVDRYASAVIEGETIPVFLIQSDNLKEEFKAPYEYLDKKKAFEEKDADFKSRWNENFLRMDMSVYQSRYTEANGKLFGKRRSLRALTSELQAYAEFMITTEQIPVLLTDITFYQQEKAEIEKEAKEFPEGWKDILEKYGTKEALHNYESRVSVQIENVEGFLDKIEEMKAAGRFSECLESAHSVMDAFSKVQSSEEKAASLLQLSFEEKEENWVKGRILSCSKLLDHETEVKDFIIYRQFSAECKAAGLDVVCDAYEDGVSHEQLIDIYLRSIYKAIALYVIEQEPALNSFTGTGFNERILQFKKLDQEFMELTKEEMYYRLTNQLPKDNESVIFSKELNILRRAISSNGRGMSIRNLFDQIPHILPKLCPCMLMSPISAAQYLSADNDPVDIVIFDEASQLPTCKAVGVLARGKNAVIVGDPNQMPPTSFFAGNSVDEDNLDIEDLDSILDDCLALGMPQSHLKWHYRSRHESLIAFSNQEFYENSMQTFPSVNDREKRVKMVKVEGCFDRGKGRVNVEEARAIVDEIKRRYHDCGLKTMSLGVVTFNISQQALIEDLLLEEFRKDAEFDAWANTGEEPLFVKNLENVQGDERDVILFSVAFGPDKEGKISMNFGPINKDGGWKRLNVAVTRAKEEMVVFSTMTSEQISLKRTRSRGVEALKHFLEYAEKGRLPMTYTKHEKAVKQGILEHICTALTEAGYEFQKNVGHSRFKIDVAVINPDKPEEYLLGVILDGDSYRQSKNTKDREVGQINVLTGLGWELHRIWTMDWWDNRDKELDKLLKRVGSLKEKPVEPVAEESLTDVSTDVILVEETNV